MTRSEALLKLLAIEPERYDRLRQITGWPFGETEATIAALEESGRIGSRASVCRSQDYRVYFLTPKRTDGLATRRNAGVVRKSRRNTGVEGPSLALSEHPRAGASLSVWGPAGSAGGANGAAPAGSGGAEQGLSG